MLNRLKQMISLFQTDLVIGIDHDVCCSQLECVNRKASGTSQDVLKCMNIFKV